MERKRDMHLIARIFFPTNVASLDSKDVAVLESVVDHVVASLIISKIRICIEGNADVRANADYNYKLSRRRARVVKRYIDIQVEKAAKGGDYYSVLRYWGEDNAVVKTHDSDCKRASRQTSWDRRVDVWCNVSDGITPPIVKQKPKLDPRPSPTTNRVQIRSEGGLSLSVGPFFGGGVQVQVIEVLNSRGNKRVYYGYYGGGGTMGAGPTITVPDLNYSWRSLPIGVDVDDLAGPGHIGSGSWPPGSPLGKSGAYLIFNGPKERNLANKEITIFMSGWQIGWGVQSDVWGHWKRIPNRIIRAATL